MVDLARPVSGDLILATHISNTTNFLLGADGYGQLARFHQISDSTNYSTIIGNEDTTNGRALQVQYGDSAGTPTVLAQFAKAAIVFNLGATLAQIATPSAPSAGYTIVYPKSDSNLYFYPTGGSETRLAAYTQTPTSILTTTGDTLYASGANTPARLAIGSTGQALTVVGGVPSWAASPTSVMTGTGDLLTTSGASTLARLAIGTAFQELVVNSGATGLQWSTGVLKTVTAAGDLVYGSGANTITRLAKGTAFQELTMNSGATAPQWSTGVLATVTTAGDLVVGSGANAISRLAKGTDGYVLTMVTGSVAWSALPAGVLPAASGSAASPTINFSGSTDTGLYLIAAGQMGITAGGTLRVTVSSSGLTMGTNLPITPGAVSGTPAANAGYQESLVKGWVNFNQGASPTINDSFNVSSVSRVAAGRHTVNWDRDFANANYACSCGPVSGYAGSAAGTPNTYVNSLAVGSTTVACVDSSSWTGNDGFAAVMVIACGKQ